MDKRPTSLLCLYSTGHEGQRKFRFTIRKKLPVFLFFSDISGHPPLLPCEATCEATIDGPVKSPYTALRFLLPRDKLGAGLFPVAVSHIMVSLSNHARALPLELFTKPPLNRGFYDFLREHHD